MSHTTGVRLTEAVWLVLYAWARCCLSGVIADVIAGWWGLKLQVASSLATGAARPENLEPAAVGSLQLVTPGLQSVMWKGC